VLARDRLVLAAREAESGEPEAEKGERRGFGGRCRRFDKEVSHERGAKTCCRSTVTDPDQRGQLR